MTKPDNTPDDLQETIAILSDLIAYPTVSADSNLAIICYIQDYLLELGANVQVLHNEEKTKANLFATLGPLIDGGIILSGHTDVVPVTDQKWQTDPFKLTQSDNLLYGRGTCDMKGFIAACLCMAKQYSQQTLKRPIHFSFTYDEETGCLGAQQLVKDMAHFSFKPSLIIIGEPTDMSIIDGHKGCFEYSTQFTGLEGHGSLPDHGVNAVAYATRYVGHLLQLAEQLQERQPADSPFDPPWSTINIGRIAGGIAHNVIPGHCEVDWEMRPVQQSDADYVKASLKTYTENTLLPAMQAVSPDAAIHTHCIAEVVGLERAQENEAVDIIRSLTGANDTQTVSFGTEAGLFQTLGIAAVVCGPGSIRQAHKPDEYISTEQLSLCLDLLRGLQEKLCY